MPTSVILDDLSSPSASLISVAHKHGLTLADLLIWLNLPETREQLALRESAALAHARHVAALNMGHAVNAVANIIKEHTATERWCRGDIPTEIRATTNVRKAAWLLLQFARIVPVNEADLRRARDASRVACLLEEQACSESVSKPQASAVTGSASAPSPRATDPLRVSAPPVSLPSHGTANVSEQTSPDSDSRATGCLPTSANNTSREPSHALGVSERTSSFDAPLPSPTFHAAGALPDLPPASSLNDDADSPLASAFNDDADSRVACLHEVQACSEHLTSSRAHVETHGCSVRGAVMPNEGFDESCFPSANASLDPPAPVPRPPHAA